MSVFTRSFHQGREGRGTDAENREVEQLFKDHGGDSVDKNGYKRTLDDHIQLAVQRMSVQVEEKVQGSYCNSKKFCRKVHIGSLIRRAIPLIVLIGYLVYLGFALYLNPAKSAFVCVVAVFVIYICINVLTGGKVRHFVIQVFSKVKKHTKLKNKRISLWMRRISTLVVALAIITFLVIDLWDEWRKWIPLGGLVVFVVLSVMFSKHPGKIKWTPVLWGIFLQFGLGLLILRWEPGFEACRWVGRQVTTFLAYTDAGSEFVFGEKYTYHPVVFKILPVVVFFSSAVSILYYLGAMQIIIKCIALILQLALATTPIESFATAAHIFIGQVESSVALKPFLVKLTESELHAVMTSGFATVAGTIIAAYVEFGVPAEHVISASFMSAPAALAIAKISVPETEVSKIKSQKEIKLPSGQESNMIEALSVGATTAVKLVAYVVVNLIAFIAVLSFLDSALSYFGEMVNYPELSFQERSAVLATYILCGFGSIAALGINLGSLSSAAPERRSQFAQLSLRSMINGNIACFMTACVAGLLYQHSQSQEATTPYMNSTEPILNSNVTLNITTLSPMFNSSQF
ncbi:solute carrier family 28 member 3-like isoform X2 [Mercenaria mercenaria]|uniref:solute carrier family 28 member 3-like isoform X2 n=1 Tax=Mercenaria mercenaria TaxID=6596 RepID=UPI00234F8F43|nr:solute carrier family 28 member 3-like isoform X2 [Mercenaria mercenaria]